MTRRDERGVAAVEMAIFTVLLVAAVALVGPLVMALTEQVKLGRTAGAAVDFATSVPDQKRKSCSGEQLGTRSPTTAQVEAEAICAHFGAPDASAPDFAVTVTPDPSAPSSIAGTEIRVKVDRTVGLGLIGAFFQRPEVTLTSEQVGIKE